MRGAPVWLAAARSVAILAAVALAACNGADASGDGRAAGDVSADMQYFREFYAGMLGKFPAKFGPIHLREE